MRLAINGRFLAAPMGGVQRFAMEVTDRLVLNGHAVVVAPADAIVPASWLERGAVRRGRLSGQAWEQLELPRATRAFDATFHPANTAPLAAGNAVLMLHDLFALQHSAWYAGAFTLWYRVLVPRIAARARVVLTTSSESARRIVETIGIPAARVRVVPQGLAPFDRCCDASEMDAALRRLGVRRPFVLTLGDGDARKNVAFAERVVREYRAYHGSAPRLVIVGSGTGRVLRTQKTVQGDEPGDTLRLGRVTDTELRALYSGASALLSPSLAEGFGRAPLEAMACGTPALVSAAAAAPDVLGDSPAVVLPLEHRIWVQELAAVMAGAVRVTSEDMARLRRRWTWDAAARCVLDACTASLTGGREA